MYAMFRKKVIKGVYSVSFCMYTVMSKATACSSSSLLRKDCYTYQTKEVKSMEKRSLAKEQKSKEEEGTKRRKCRVEKITDELPC